jgi:hypothetical protein
MKILIYTGLFLGSLAGGYVPLIWGGSILSVTSILLSGVGALFGIWVGFKIGQRMGL